MPIFWTRDETDRAIQRRYRTRAPITGARPISETVGAWLLLAAMVAALGAALALNF